MWALYFIENVHFEDGSVGAAVLARFHHATADGIRLTQAVMGLCDLDPSDVTAVGRPFSHPSTPVQVATSVAKETLSDLADFGTAAVRTVGGVASSARDVVVALSLAILSKPLPKLSTTARTSSPSALRPSGSLSD